MRRPLATELQHRVLTLDGAMGTMIQRLGLKGCNDELVITRPDTILDIHRAYIEAGADIIETDTFNANAISLAEYGLADKVYELNVAAARLAREAAGSDRYVAGSIGPTNVSLSLADSDVTFSDMAATYCEQARGLIDGEVDALLIETVFDTLNAKAAIAGCNRAMTLSGRNVPLMISATLTENGRLLSGQTIEAFIDSISHARPLSIGFNCGFGVEQMLPYIERLQQLDCFISLHANAGLPDELGRYRQSAGEMSFTLARLLQCGKLNIAGGCCGTTPEHIAAIARAASTAVPYRPKAPDTRLHLSGLEPLRHDDFFKVGERCNVAGSRNFLKLIQQGELSKAVEIAATQIDNGASILDINMDDGMLDARTEMRRFIARLALDPRTSAVPLMIDSSDFSVITGALELIQGRSIVNSISLKEGEEKFLDRARQIHELGAAVVVMAFDEQGQADTYQRRIEICRRSYDLLTQKAGFRGNEIVFDPNVLTVATGIPDHDNYALDFIRATQWITENLPNAMVSGGVSNLSFAFRGNNAVRKAMHALFIDHARRSGLSMAIVNPSAPIAPTPDMPDDLLEAIDDVLLNRRADATGRLTAIASGIKADAPAAGARQSSAQPATTLAALILNGADDGIEQLLDAELARRESAMAVINGPLMEAMDNVGRLFGEGRIFLPQVVRSAAVMRRAIDYLTPLIEAGSSSTANRPKMVLATVKGDVHDIGKNIVATVMRCSGFDVIDLGVMVPPEQIIDAAISHEADLIGLSGLITPSLNEMCVVARMLQERGASIPLFVGGATTSEMHTAVKIAPLYSAPVIHTADAASLPPKALKLDEIYPDIKTRQQALRDEFERREQLLDIEAARERSEAVSEPAATPSTVGTFTYHPAASELAGLINWRAFLGEWSVAPDFDDERVRQLIADARALLDDSRFDIKARVIIAGARRTAPERISVNGIDIITPRSLMPNPATGKCPALADYIATDNDHIGLFAVSVHSAQGQTDEYNGLMLRIVSHRLAEAATQWLHNIVRTELWNIADNCGIRPAVGYPSLPDHSLIFTLDRQLRLAELGISLTENGAMSPDSSTCGIIISHPESRYFSVVR